MFQPLTMTDLFADPLIAQVNEADKVDPSSFEAIIRNAATKLSGARPADCPLAIPTVSSSLQITMGADRAV